LNAHGYELDAAQQRTRQMRTNSAASHSHTLGYQYDGMGQVTHARATNNATGLPVTGELLGLTYDAAWNMTARTNGGTVNYGVNNLNQVTGDGGTYTYTYDNNGNRTYRTASGGGYVLMVYDDENQLIRQETDTSTTWESYRFKLEYVYDGKLRLRERKYYTWLSGSWYPTSTERYVYDGMLLVQERPSSPSVCYTRGVDLSGSLDGAGGIGGLLARSHGFNSGTGAWSTHSAYHADGNGNVTALFSTSTGSQVAWYRYDAFGRQLQSSGTLSGANRMRFSSKPWMAPAVDDSAGMYYYGYRFYDPLTQRWVNRDPVEEGGGLNVYGFVGNSASQLVDPLGKKSLSTVKNLGDFWIAEAMAGAFLDCIDTVRDALRLPGETNNDKRNHCVASCLITAKCGTYAAISLGNIKEGRDVFMGIVQGVGVVIVNDLIVDTNRRNDIEDWLEDNIQGHGLIEAFWDQVANMVGRSFAGCGVDCRKKCGVIYGE